MSSEHGMDFVKIILDAGLVVKLDLLLLIIASVVSWGIIFKKIALFKKIKASDEDFYEEFDSADSLSELFERSNTIGPSPASRTFNAGYNEFTKIREANGGDLVRVRKHFTDFGMKSIERSLDCAIVKEEEVMGDSLTTLASIGSITPFVGLFGTVWGIIDSFANLAKGGATLEMVAPGIAEALIATGAGLVAAIPAVWYYNKFGSRKAKIKESLSVFGEKFVNEVERILASKTQE